MSYTATGSVADLFDAAPIELAARRIAERCQERLLELVKEYTPVAQLPDGQERSDWLRGRGGRKPGTLKESWEKGEIEVLSHGRYRVTVLTEDAIAKYVEYPTRPHIIRARRAKALRFYQNGELRVVHSVQHPGTEGSFMMMRALDQLRVEWQRIGREELVLLRAR